MPPRPRSRILPSGRFALIAVVALVAVALVRQGRGSVRVPPVVGEDVVSAYARLHAARLRVSILRAFPLDSACAPAVAGTAPSVGSRLARSGNVTLALSARHCPAIPLPNSGRHVRVPGFVGRSLAAPAIWAHSHRTACRTTLPPLRRGDAASFYANFAVRAQQPGPGNELSPQAPLRLTLQTS